MVGSAGFGSAGFFQEMARRQMPKPPQSPRQAWAQGTVGPLFRQQSPFQGSTPQPQPQKQQGGFTNVPGDWRYWRQRLSGGTKPEHLQGTGDRYANLTSDPFSGGRGY